KYCVYCLAEVSPLRFRCAECQDIELCPCPGCFSAGAEIRHHHRRYHGYQLMDGGRFTLWGPEATGEQLLLDAMEQFSFGNWEDMATHVGASRTPQEVMEHYTSRWPSSSSWNRVRPERQDAPQQALRQGGNDVEIELKRAHLDLSLCKFRERQRCKNIARGHNLVPAFLGKEKERAARCKVTKVKELRLKLRPVYQFMSCKEFDDLLEYMHKEKMLRAKIRKLQRYGRKASPRWRSWQSRGSPAQAGKAQEQGGGGGGAKRGKEDGRDGEFADIEHLPGFELLSDREKVLCSSLNLSPKHFVTVKTIIIKDHLPKRQGIPSKSRLPSYLDKVLKKWILNFLTDSRWISRDTF
ncbi:hypothetical protein K5549_020494, partial [Capra hircus]